MAMINIAPQVSTFVCGRPGIDITFLYLHVLLSSSVFAFSFFAFKQYCKDVVSLSSPLSSKVVAHHIQSAGRRIVIHDSS